MILFLIFILCVILFVNRKLRRDVIIQKYQFKIYKLRDELREKLIDDEINPNNWLFDYLDRSFAKAAKVLKDLTFYKAIYLTSTHKNDDKFLALIKHMEIGFKGDPVLKDIHERYSKLLIYYFIERHFAVFAWAISIIASVFYLKKFKNIIFELGRNTTVLPETSAYAFAK